VLLLNYILKNEMKNERIQGIYVNELHSRHKSYTHGKYTKANA